MGKIKNKAKKKQLSDKIKVDRVKKKVMNPFEVHVNRQKYDVLGRKMKHDKGLPGISRAKAISKRKKTLLQEYKVRDKSNRFLDRRIGEKNSAMTSEDRIMARFTAERMKMHNRKSIFNLADDEVLTHRGQTLNEIEKFDDPRSDDEEEQEKLDADFVEDAHFGGGILKKTNGKTTSRKDLIEQLIAESKKRKAEKQKLREQTVELTEKLDTEWRDLLPIVKASNKYGELEENDKPDSYDTAMRQLKFEARGKPSDRLKTEEEIAKEEKERLEKLEEERLQRMHGVKEDVPQRKHKSADDLDDGFKIEPDEDSVMMTYNEEGQLENADILKEGVTKEEVQSKDSEKNEQSSDDSEEEEKEVTSDEDDNDDDDEDDSLSDLKNASESEEEEEKKETTNEIVKADLLKRKKIMEQARKELPFTFKIPATYEELQTLLNTHDFDHQAVILERMIKCNHPSLGEGFKDQLSNLFAFLLQHLQDTAVSGDNCFALLDRIASHLYDLCHVSTQNAGRCIAEVIREKQHDFQSHSRSYPGLDTLVFLKLVSLLFPTSDFRHPVVTPALVFVCQMLDQCRIRNTRDVSTGIFLTTLLLEYTILSKRFSPSAVNFLHGVIHMAIPKSPTKLTNVVYPLYISTTAMNLLVVEENSPEDYPRVPVMNVADLQGETDKNFKVRALHVSVKLLQDFCDNLKEMPSSFQVFTPVVNTINKLNLQKYPGSVADSIKSLVSSVEKLSQQKLPYLVMEKKKPKALRLYEPRIEEVIDGRKRRPMGKERQEREKLLHKYKREMKGAVREIRRDKTFLAKLKLKQTLHSDMERKQKVKEIFGSAAVQQGELNKLKRKKIKL